MISRRRTYIGFNHKKKINLFNMFEVLKYLMVTNKRPKNTCSYRRQLPGISGVSILFRLRYRNENINWYGKRLFEIFIIGIQRVKQYRLNVGVELPIEMNKLYSKYINLFSRKKGSGTWQRIPRYSSQYPHPSPCLSRMISLISPSPSPQWGRRRLPLPFT